MSGFEITWRFNDPQSQITFGCSVTDELQAIIRYYSQVITRFEAKLILGHTNNGRINLYDVYFYLKLFEE